MRQSRKPVKTGDPTSYRDAKPSQITVSVAVMLSAPRAM
jgi:hypothetical protein